MEDSPNDSQPQSKLECRIFAGLYFAFIACGHPGVYLSFIFFRSLFDIEFSAIERISVYVWGAEYILFALIIYCLWRRGVVFVLSFFKRFNADVFLHSKKTRPFMILGVVAFYAVLYWALSGVKMKMRLFIGFAHELSYAIILGFWMLLIIIFTMILFVLDIYFAFRKKAVA
ncbi:MAG: hypothetical protein J0G29_05210 [Alphaproteobacteria bacterium]|nr:hypothetical protein [Alphaproteobacteria bacterium]OJV45154.1 MAG: hypothetical protein BGO28_03990 [Alphaproteobacteria bacterium 43-37]